MESLSQRLGGETAIDHAVDLFYERVLGDPLLSPFFRNTDMQCQRNHQKRFLVMAFGGGNHYSGQGMRKAHEHLVTEQGLNDVHFDAVVGHLAATLSGLGVTTELIAEVGTLANTLRNDVLNR